MSIAAKLRKGQGPFWGTVKWAARQVLHFHLPVAGPTRPLFRLLYLVHVAGREGLAWLLRFVWYEPLFRSQCAAVGADLEMERLPYLAGKGRIVLGDRVRLSGKPAFGFSNAAHADPELVVGDGTFIGHDCGFHVAGSVRIGKNCLIAQAVRFYDFDGHPLDAAKRRAHVPPAPEEVRPVVVGDDVWIGTTAVVLKGVTIGDRSVVAAGAVVSRDVPPDVVVAGNPARIVKHLAPAAEVAAAPSGNGQEVPA
jgi:acetyltransferase-like isoleucine patch superfamily enzyme